MDNLTKNTIALVVAFLLILGAFYVNNYDGQTENNNNQNQNEEVNEERNQAVDLEENINWERGISFGDREAPIKIVNFSSYSCPYCSRFEKEVFPQIKKEYVDNGDVFFLFRGLGEPSSTVYQSVFCAQEQLSEDDLITYQSNLFSDKINRNSDLSDLLTVSTEEGLEINEDNFEACLEEDKYQEVIEIAGQEAQDLQLKGTPYLLVDGEEMVGFRSFEEYKQLIDQKLNENN